MKSIWLLTLALLTSVSWAMDEEDIRYLPELRSAAWSPDLTKEDIRKMRFAIFRMTKSNARYAREDLKPYISDKRNVEARYVYSLALAERNINQAIENLKELSIEGYPYALETYGEERVCSLKQYRDICDEFGFNEVKKRAYLAWARKDPLIPNMYYYAFRNSPNGGYIGNYSEQFTTEGEAILKEGMEAESYYAAATLYQKNLELGRMVDSLYQTTKRLLLKGNSWGSTSVPERACFENKRVAIEQNEICLSDSEIKTLLDNFAKYGNIAAYGSLIYATEYKSGEPFFPSLDEYIRFGDNENKLSPELKAKYDRAIELNNGRGWAYHGVQQSIENWEKLFNDKKIKGFFEKVGTMFN